eukprot:4565979-Alexandrium_andersonii.AAC.1
MPTCRVAWATLRMWQNSSFSVVQCWACSGWVQLGRITWMSGSPRAAMNIWTRLVGTFWKIRRGEAHGTFNWRPQQALGASIGGPWAQRHLEEQWK